MVRLLQQIAGDLGCSYQGLSKNWISVLTREADGVQVIVYGCVFPLNGQSCASLASDKAATSEILALEGVPHIPHTIVYGPSFRFTMDPNRQGTMTSMLEALEEWAPEGLVLKPKSGTSGTDVRRARSQLELEAGWLALLREDKDFVFGPFVPLEHEWRVVILDGELQLCFRKSRQSGEWRHNIACGSTAEPETDADLIARVLEPLAQRAMRALGLRFSSVDIVNVARSDGAIPPRYASLCDENGFMVLEVNSAVFVDGYLKQQPAEWGKCLRMYGRAVAEAFKLAHGKS